MTLGRRESFSGDDIVRIMVDTFLDESAAWTVSLEFPLQFANLPARRLRIDVDGLYSRRENLALDDGTIPATLQRTPSGRMETGEPVFVKVSWLFRL